MNRYDSYIDSGVEWMNEIPSNWEKSRIRMVGDLYGGLTGKKGSDFNWEVLEFMKKGGDFSREVLKFTKKSHGKF